MVRAGRKASRRHGGARTEPMPYAVGSHSVDFSSASRSGPVLVSLPSQCNAVAISFRTMHRPNPARCGVPNPSAPNAGERQATGHDQRRGGGAVGWRGGEAAGRTHAEEGLCGIARSHTTAEPGPARSRAFPSARRWRGSTLNLPFFFQNGNGLGLQRSFHTPKP